MSDAPTSDPAFDVPPNRLTKMQTIDPSARLALAGAVLGLLPSAYRRLRYGKEESGNTGSRTATEAAIGAGLLGSIPWLARPRFAYDVPGTLTPRQRTGEDPAAYNERVRIKSWDDVRDRLFLPRETKIAAFRKVAQASAAVPRNGRPYVNQTAADVDATFRQHFTPEQLAASRAQEAAESTAQTARHEARMVDPRHRNVLNTERLQQFGQHMNHINDGYNAYFRDPFLLSFAGGVAPTGWAAKGWKAYHAYQAGKHGLGAYNSHRDAKGLHALYEPAVRMAGDNRDIYQQNPGAFDSPSQLNAEYGAARELRNAQLAAAGVHAFMGSASALPGGKYLTKAVSDKLPGAVTAMTRKLPAWASRFVAPAATTTARATLGAPNLVAYTGAGALTNARAGNAHRVANPSEVVMKDFLDQDQRVLDTYEGK